MVLADGSSTRDALRLGLVAHVVRHGSRATRRMARRLAALDPVVGRRRCLRAAHDTTPRTARRA
jgi:enoyl-CoA hydratase/carnithine racemase